MKRKKYQNKNGFDAEAEFIEDFPFAFRLLEYVKSISGVNQWFIEECINDEEGVYYAIFRSFKDYEHGNCVLSIRTTFSSSDWHFSVQKQVTKLL